MNSMFVETTPMGYKRMTKNSIWKHKDYHEYMQLIQETMKKQSFVPSDTLNIVFYLPMPKSWSKKKKKDYENTAHQQRPDLDNLVKAVLDALFYKREGGDSRVYLLHAAKTWQREPGVVIANI